MLTEFQQQQWHSDGFIKIENFFNAEILNKISTYVDEIARWDISEDKWMMWFEKTRDNKKILSKVENFFEFHKPLYTEIFSNQIIQRIVSELLEEKIKLLKESLIFKYPGSGGYRPHQDVYSVPYKLPHRQVHAVVMVAIDDSVPENGGLYFSKGHHKKGILPLNEQLVMLPDVSKEFTWEPIYCNAGDIFIFDNHAPHYSEPNKSERSRRTMYLVFQRESTIGLSRAEYNIKKRAVAPPENENFDLYNLKKPNEIIYRDE